MIVPLRMQAIQDFILAKGLSFDGAQTESLVREALDCTPEEMEEFFGDGPLRALLEDRSITEILVNGMEDIWFERDGRLERHSKGFACESSLRRYVRRVLSQVGKKVDQQSPFADASREDGTRFHISIPPISRGINISIRKPRVDGWTLERFISAGTMSASLADYLTTMVREKKNILISGGTGAGKTSLLNALASTVTQYERVIALEDVRELRPSHPHFLSLQTRNENEEGVGGVSLRRLLKESLRMRPDRLVIGECRGQEALDMVLCLGSGHAGSFATIHAGSARAALHRLETLSLLGAQNIRGEGVRALVAAAVQVVVQLSREGGVRKVAEVAEIRGAEGENFLLKQLRL